MTRQLSVKVGDTVYVDSYFYLSHGADDFVGGKAIVTEVVQRRSAGKPCNFIRIAEYPSALWNWDQELAPRQVELSKRFGEKHAHADPDERPEFNKWD